MAATILVFDFDQTMFQTFEPGPSGLTIESAYEQAVLEVLGPDLLATYRANGGLRNRASDEVVHELHPDWPAGLIAQCVQQMTAHRLRLLLSEIGPQWPRPCQGFAEFWQDIDAWRREGRLVTAIVSSGHAPFIRRVFKVRGLRLPDVMVTAEAMSRLQLSLQRRVKPSTVPLAYALHQLREGRRAKPPHQRLPFRPNAPFDTTGVRYFGDDPGKDGQLAQRAGVPFGWYRPEDEVPRSLPNGPSGYPETSFCFPDWEIVTLMLPAWLE